MAKLIILSFFALITSNIQTTSHIAITSSVVGYITDAPKNTTGYSFIIPTFTSVGGTAQTYGFQDIKLDETADGSGMTDCVVGYDGDACLTGVDYFWTTPEGSDGLVEEAGWYEFMDSTPAPNTPLPIGTGIYLQLFNDAKVSVAGQVYTGTLVSEALPAGYNMVGNSSPVEIDLQDLKLGEAADGSGMTDCIVGYDADACLTGIDYFWTTVAGSDGMVDEDGWYEFMGDTLIDGVKLAPGEGVYLQLFNEGVTFTIPSPMKK